MGSIIRYSAHELPDDEERALETLLKQALVEGERVFIMTCRPDIVPDAITLRRPHAALIQTLNQAARRRREQGVTAEAANATIEEATRHVRPWPS